MNELEEALDLLAAARRDVTALQVMMDPAIVAEEIFGFHVQQAAEKMLKAWLAVLGAEYPRTHDIGILLRLLAPLSLDVAELSHLVRWNLFAVQFCSSTWESSGEPLDRPAARTTVADLFEKVNAIVLARQT